MVSTCSESATDADAAPSTRTGRRAEAFAIGPVLASGCTGSRAERLGWRLSLTALGLFGLYLATNSPLAALGVAGTLVPGCLLTSCQRSQLVELERRALGWRLMRAFPAELRTQGAEHRGVGVRRPRPWAGPSRRR